MCSAGYPQASESEAILTAQRIGCVWIKGDGQPEEAKGEAESTECKVFSKSNYPNLKESNCGSLVQLLCMTFNRSPWIQNEMGHLWVSPGQISFHSSHSAAQETPGSCHFQTYPWILCLFWQWEVESEKSLWAPTHFKLIRPLKGGWVVVSPICDPCERAV